MPYLIYVEDHIGMNDIRESLREEHRKHLKSLGGLLLASGALLDDHDNVIGGLSLVDLDKEAALLFAKTDPYELVNIRKKTKVIKWRNRWWNGKFDEEKTKFTKKI